MKYTASSMMIGRKPRGGNTFKTAFVKFFDTNDPLGPEVLPKEEIDFEDVREVIFSGFDIRYLLEGNDLLVTNIKQVEITENKDTNVLFIANIVDETEEE
ncbi:hypothetical protein JXM83_04500 [Candidatus Woesearchaeota archaeon]|nr:hypothetical protein [Candidatus Woesearchaeota archaeon]